MRTGRSGQEDPQSLDPAVLSVDLSREIDALKGESAWQAGDRNARTLFKDVEDLRVVLTVLKSGAQLARHQAPGRAVIHVLGGQLRVALDGETHNLGAGQLLVIEPGRAHDVVAEQESAFLLTICWPNGRP